MSSTSRIPEKAWSVLACAQCARPLERTPRGVQCASCELEFPVNEAGGIDLRLKGKKHIELGFDLGESLLPEGRTFPPLPPHPQPEVQFGAGNVPWHLNAALLSYFPRARSDSSLALDLGCGSGVHREVCEHAGHCWIGLDYTDARAPILGDGHALPFLDGSIDFVLSIAVMEHIRYPFVLAHEVLSVL